MVLKTVGVLMFSYGVDAVVFIGQVTKSCVRLELAITILVPCRYFNAKQAIYVCGNCKALYNLWPGREESDGNSCLVVFNKHCL